ncbi:hypothetical protein ACJZ2D_002405 [Fusarium nematophilum]
MRALILLLAVQRFVSAGCECGYFIRDAASKQPVVFMDSLETDFTRVGDISENHEWVRQEFTVSAKAGRGEHSKNFMPSNIGTRLAKNGGGSDEQTGLGLRVGSEVDHDGAVSAAEIDTARLDLHWGSFRAGMKATPINGTCAAFFWVCCWILEHEMSKVDWVKYFNDTQEIDIEFLSREFDHDQRIYPVNLVVQSNLSLEAGYDARRTGTFERVNLDFDPTDAFHEYRFDYTPGRVRFYADSKLLAQMEGNAMPSVGGHLILQHWSNGNPLWSGGPPANNATITVNYVKAYFNSSDGERQSRLLRRCLDRSQEATLCEILDVTAKNATSGGLFFGHSQDPENDERTETSGSTSGVEVTAVAWHRVFFVFVFLHVGLEMLHV